MNNNFAWLSIIPVSEKVIMYSTEPVQEITDEKYADACQNINENNEAFAKSNSSVSDSDVPL